MTAIGPAAPTIFASRSGSTAGQRTIFTSTLPRDHSATLCLRAVTKRLQQLSLPGSAWERPVLQAPSALRCEWPWVESAAVRRGGASKIVRSQAEPGNDGQ